LIEIGARDGSDVFVTKQLASRRLGVASINAPLARQRASASTMGISLPHRGQNTGRHSSGQHLSSSVQRICASAASDRSDNALISREWLVLRRATRRYRAVARQLHTEVSSAQHSRRSFISLGSSMACRSNAETAVRRKRNELSMLLNSFSLLVKSGREPCAIELRNA
jgi:hypothetical protein